MRVALLVGSSIALLVSGHAVAAPTKVTLLADVLELSSRGDHSCVRRKDGAVLCWGARAGAATAANAPVLLENATTAVRVASLPFAKTIAVGTAHACALVLDGTIRCWGDNRFGALGFGPKVGSSGPVAVFGLDHKHAIDALVAHDHTCALSSTKGAWCWGGNAVGAMLTPVGGAGYPEVSHVLVDSDDVALGVNHVCKLQKGIARCFGEGIAASPAKGGFALSANIVGKLTKVTAMAAGRGFTCVVNDGVAYCFGRNDAGQLGDGTKLMRTYPVLATKGVHAIATGDRHTCAVRDDGGVLCWGENDRGQLGNGTKTSSLVAVSVVGVTTARAIAAGASHTCALLADGTVRCWGKNDRGQLGDGDITDASAPHAVRID